MARFRRRRRSLSRRRGFRRFGRRRSRWYSSGRLRRRKRLKYYALTRGGIRL